MEPKVLTVEDFVNGTKSIEGVDKDGNAVKYILLTGNRIATIREGKGKDVERATIESAGDQSKYLSSLMSACATIEGVHVNMFDLAEMKIKDYTAIQIAFAELNF
jgi:hypothetical protein